MMRQVLYEMSQEYAAKVQLQKEVQAVSETLNSDQTLFVSAWADYDRDDVVTLWVATCLSAGVNPNHKAAHSKEFAQRMVAIGSAADDCIKKLNEVLRRYKNVSIHAKNPNSSLNTADELRTKIELSAFRKWVEAEKNWELPKGFPGARALLAGPDQPNVETPSPAPEHQDAPVATASPPGGWGWTLKKPQRFPGYRKPLYDLLRTAQIDGKPCPTARDVLDTWRDKMPPEVMEVMTDGLKYYDAKGDAKPADLNAIRKAIGRMTRQAPVWAGKRTFKPTS